MRENKITILSTRPLDQALTDQAAAMDIVIDSLSFIETHKVQDPALDDRIRHLSQESLVAVFTSMNAVTAVADRLSVTTRALWQIYCIGAATRELVLENFGEDSIAGTAPSAAALADTIIRDHPSRVCFFCGDLRRDELPDQLQQNGVDVDELVVYRTQQIPHRLEKNYDGIAFFSPSAVHSFFSLNTVAPETILFAIGHTTAATIHHYTNNKTIQTGSPEKESLIRLAIDYFKQ